MPEDRDISMKRLPLLFSLALIHSAAFAALPDVINQSYEQARPKLIENGFSPLSPEEIEALQGSSVDYGPGESEMFRMGYTEVSSCTGSGVPTCTFLMRAASGLVYKVEVYVPEDESETRVESVSAVNSQGFNKQNSLKILEQRIAATSKIPYGNAPLPVSPCDDACIETELSKWPTISKAFNRTIDERTGYELIDYSDLNIIDFHKTAKTHGFKPIPLNKQPDAWQDERTTYVLNKLTSGSLRECLWRQGENIATCKFIYQGSNGYLFQFSATGSDLSDYRVSSVTLVNDDPAFAEYTTPELASSLRYVVGQRLSLSNPTAYRQKMAEELSDSNDISIQFVNKMHAASRNGHGCNVLIASSYLTAISDRPLEEKRRTIEVNLASLENIDCIR